MERAMSVEERIKKAEDIYNRRNGVSYSRQTNSKPKREKRKNIKKLFMQIFICMLIYIVFYAVTNREFVFSKEFRNEVNIFFTEKTNLNEWYTNIKSYFSGKLNNSEETEDSQDKKNDNKEENTEKSEEQNNDKQDTNKDENIGGAEEQKEEIKNESVEETKEENSKEISENEKMILDAKEIKSKISFITPVEGRISSTFGWRNLTTASVPKYHTGLDIAANEGTVIKSATDGIIILASKVGDYGNHYQIKIDNIIIVYAHCKKLYLKEGDTVKQGQKIAEVGSTGNSTGPHLHFEIRKGDEKIDPQLILDI